MIATTERRIARATQSQLESFFESIGEKRLRRSGDEADSPFCVDDFDAMSNLGRPARKAQAGAEIAPEVVSEDIPATAPANGSCVSSRQLCGNCVHPQGGRGTLCVSSQAGCALDCSFCSTGKQGFNSNLTAAEVIGQVWIVTNHSAPSRRKSIARSPTW